MYVVLSLTPDRNGHQGQVALNTDRINGFRENCYHDIGGNVEKDAAGSVSYTHLTLPTICSV